MPDLLHRAQALAVDVFGMRHLHQCKMRGVRGDTRAFVYGVIATVGAVVALGTLYKSTPVATLRTIAVTATLLPLACTRMHGMTVADIDNLKLQLHAAQQALSECRSRQWAQRALKQELRAAEQKLAQCRSLPAARHAPCGPANTGHTANDRVQMHDDHPQSVQLLPLPTVYKFPSSIYAWEAFSDKHVYSHRRKFKVSC